MIWSLDEGFAADLDVVRQSWQCLDSLWPADLSPPTGSRSLPPMSCQRSLTPRLSTTWWFSWQVSTWSPPDVWAEPNLFRIKTLPWWSWWSRVLLLASSPGGWTGVATPGNHSQRQTFRHIQVEHFDKFPSNYNHSLQDIQAEELWWKLKCYRQLYEPGLPTKECHGGNFSGASGQHSGSAPRRSDGGCEGLNLHGVWSENGGELVQLRQQFCRVRRRDALQICWNFRTFLLPSAVVQQLWETFTTWSELLEKMKYFFNATTCCVTVMISFLINKILMFENTFR